LGKIEEVTYPYHFTFRERFTMRRFLLGAGILALLMSFVPSAGAREPMTKVIGQRDPGIRGDRFVPYKTNGRNALGNSYVVPILYSSPIVSDTQQPSSRKVYNIIFQGAVHEFGGTNEGAARRFR
jgi:hypothetical protein